MYNGAIRSQKRTTKTTVLCHTTVIRVEKGTIGGKADGQISSLPQFWSNLESSLGTEGAGAGQTCTLALISSLHFSQIPDSSPQFMRTPAGTEAGSGRRFTLTQKGEATRATGFGAWKTSFAEAGIGLDRAAKLIGVFELQCIQLRVRVYARGRCYRGRSEASDPKQEMKQGMISGDGVDSDLDAIRGSKSRDEQYIVEAHKAIKGGGARDEVLPSTGTVDGDKSHRMRVVCSEGLGQETGEGQAELGAVDITMNKGWTGLGFQRLMMCLSILCRFDTSSLTPVPRVAYKWILCLTFLCTNANNRKYCERTVATYQFRVRQGAGWSNPGVVLAVELFLGVLRVLPRRLQMRQRLCCLCVELDVPSCRSHLCVVAGDRNRVLSRHNVVECGSRDFVVYHARHGGGRPRNESVACTLSSASSDCARFVCPADWHWAEERVSVGTESPSSAAERAVGESGGCPMAWFRLTAQASLVIVRVIFRRRHDWSRPKVKSALRDSVSFELTLTLGHEPEQPEPTPVRACAQHILRLAKAKKLRCSHSCFAGVNVAATSGDAPSRETAAPLSGARQVFPPTSHPHLRIPEGHQVKL
ncbi:hypothetical protein BDV93DRAFT_512179 [Ceratobasidium sp. AG-I]|nr:hypothetical protein BDV93DRAFT_512179 [Ceratobasidium sp. AG-I]